MRSGRLRRWLAAIGVLEGGLAGALILYGAPADTTAAAALIYHAVALAVRSLARVPHLIRSPPLDSAS